MNGQYLSQVCYFGILTVSGDRLRRPKLTTLNERVGFENDLKMYKFMAFFQKHPGLRVRLSVPEVTVMGTRHFFFYNQLTITGSRYVT